MQKKPHIFICASLMGNIFFKHLLKPRINLKLYVYESTTSCIQHSVFKKRKDCECLKHDALQNFKGKQTNKNILWAMID